MQPQSFPHDSEATEHWDSLPSWTRGGATPGLSITDFVPRPSSMGSPASSASTVREEILELRSNLRDLEQRRGGLLVETAALRLWGEAPAEGGVPRWVTDAAIRRRQAEAEELAVEIRELVCRITTLCDRLPQNIHGTPSLELEPIPTGFPEDAATGSVVSRILMGLNRSRRTRPSV
jgi:microcystin degradation protein MlrC